MALSPLAGRPAPPELRVDLARLEREYYERVPDVDDPEQRVSFGTSGHRGSSLRGSFTEAHIAAIAQAICEHRRGEGIDGPLYLGRDTHALSGPAQRTALEVLAANGVETFLQQDDADQDGAIAGAAIDAGRGIIIAANKWDLMKGEGPEGAKHFDENLRHQLKFLDFAPILHISAKTGERAPKLLETIEKVSAARNTRVPTGELNRFIEAITTAHPPVSPGRRNVRVLYAAQTGVAPPSFVLFTNIATKLHFSYERFLEIRLRAEYGFFGTPIRISVRRRAEHRGRGARTGSRL